MPGIRKHDTSLNFTDGEIHPIRDFLIVKPMPPALSQTIAADWNGEAVRGKVIKAGPGCYPNIHERGFKDGTPYRRVRQSKVYRPTEVKPGDVVQLGGMEIGGYLWKHVWLDGEDHILIDEDDVCFVED
jgi:hypothetical protein